METTLILPEDIIWKQIVNIEAAQKLLRFKEFQTQQNYNNFKSATSILFNNLNNMTIIERCIKC
jgi:hypothetical protein